MSNKSTAIISIGIVSFILLLGFGITDRKILAERRTYASQEEMQTALQGKYVQRSPSGDELILLIEGNTALETYTSGNPAKYRIMEWNYRRGSITLFREGLGNTEKLYTAKDGTLVDQTNRKLHRSANKFYSSYCHHEGCNKKFSGIGTFCPQHECSHSNCCREVISGSFYCDIHTCQGGTQGCYNMVDGYHQKCNACQNPEKDSSPTYFAPAYQPAPSKPHKIEMPDCDDYESYEEFMDEWDGNMPDGSDAEDYWADW